MGIYIHDLENHEEYLRVSWWYWRPTIELMRQSKIIDEKRLELMGYNYGLATVSKEEANQLVKWLEENIVPKVKPGERMMLDGKITSNPDDGTFYKEKDKIDLNYSIDYEWLLQFIDLLRKYNGFKTC